jgi:hypothetical protein
MTEFLGKNFGLRTPEQNQSNCGFDECIQGGFLLRKKPLCRRVFGYINSDSALVLQLYFVEFMESPRRPGPKGHDVWLSFRGLKPPAPSGISDLQL